MAGDFAAGIAALNSVAVALDASGPKLAAAGDKIVRKTAKDVEAYAKQIVAVDTGNLRSTISTTITRYAAGSGFGTAAEIGPTASYGGYVEWGTERMAPQAYMGPALDRYSGGFVDALLAAADPLGGLT